ncbi:phosphocholine cytidylyltransferase family protein [Chitiniphilus eburneus]|uniref:Phosphocholine cytidylyltransferase family protein n=1 Tax=Chitiniphilus eburneus TaxID=2571148 RepID=A0A4U0PZE9_9NEIS|nr:phosphocholine cytidylyltransferase family protein [Chitiniphilus eburneus]TJZ74046.1 phosphocholine cytidylyltransferase family protein [Chitiniphilus eburneus]
MTRAIILAAGRGSRMGALTTEQPKCFTPLHGRRLLDWQLTALRAAGICEIAIVRGYCADKFTEPVHYFDNPRWAETNMVRTLAQAAPWLAAEDCIVSYSDIFYSAETVRRLAACDEELAISYDPDWLAVWQRRFDDPLADAETFRRHADGTLAEIGQRSASIDEIEGQYMGLLKLTPAAWGRIAALLDEKGAGADKLDMTSLLRNGLALGWRIGTVPVAGSWGEVDSAGDLAAYAEVDFDHVAD